MSERKPLPDTRPSRTHSFKIYSSTGDFTVHIIVGLYEDGTPGELYINIGKQGSTIRGLADTIARLFSYALQYGVPLEVLVGKFRDTRFEPEGTTSNPDIPKASSIIDYIVRWMGREFLEDVSQ